MQVVGGTARLPLFAAMVCEQLGPEAETVRDLDPMLAVAAGAALALYRVETPAAPQAVAAVARAACQGQDQGSGRRAGQGQVWPPASPASSATSLRAW